MTSSEHAHPLEEEPVAHWKSPEMPPIIVPTNDDSTTIVSEQQDSNGRVAQIPVSGWYGLLFTNKKQTESDNDDDESQSDDDASGSSSDNDRNHRRESKALIRNNKDINKNNNRSDEELNYLKNYEFWFSISSNQRESLAHDDEQQDSKGGERISKPITLLPDAANKGQEMALDVGMLHYFPKGSLVAVLQKQKHKEKSSEEINSGTGCQEETLHWYLLYRKRISEDIIYAGFPIEHKAISSSSSPTGDSSPNLPEPGDECSNKKPFVCGGCEKRFASPKAVSDHYHKMHQAKHNRQNTTKNNPMGADTESCLPKTLAVIYQDNSMAVIDKPQGVAVMGNGPLGLVRSNLFLPLTVPPQDREMVEVPTTPIQNDDDDSATANDIAEEATSTTCRPRYKYLGKPRVVHRLDAATGGILVLAKTKEAERHLKGSFATHEKCRKRYRALLLGRLEPTTGRVDLAVDGREAITHYSVLQYHSCKYERTGWVTVVDLFPKTGRRHQLRKHMKSLGHSIWGDKRYGGIILPSDLPSATKSADSAKGQDGAEERMIATLMSRLCLWAVELTLPHPMTNEDKTFLVQDPDWLDYVIQQSQPDSNNS